METEGKAYSNHTKKVLSGEHVFNLDGLNSCNIINNGREKDF